MARPEDNVNFTSVHVVPNNLKQRFEYYQDGTIKYAGHAKKGSDEGDETAWTIQYFQNNATPATESIDIAYGSWTNRASYTYD
jgi:hypothetical protein